MKPLAVVLALLIALPPMGRAAQDVAASTVPVTEPITVTAPRVKNQAVLETVRATGAGTAVAGAGLMTYAVFISAAGPIGWAAALIFLGGMTAYLSHRRLEGKQDFSWSIPPEDSAGEHKSGVAPAVDPSTGTADDS